MACSRKSAVAVVMRKEVSSLEESTAKEEEIVSRQRMRSITSARTSSRIKLSKSIVKE